MLTNLFENRGKEFSNLLKIGDYLGRSLRENVELFSVDNGIVTYLTESGSVISGKYAFKPNLKLTNINVEDSSVLENQEAFDKVTEKKVFGLISNLFEDSYDKAQGTFDEILGLFETKMSYERIKTRLQDKTQRFGSQTNIINTPEFSKITQLKDKISEFLKESNASNIPEIKNSVKLASVIAKSFNLPKIDIKTLEESKVFEVTPIANHSVYEHLCHQELIRKELLEAKVHLDTTWAHDEAINELASMIYESNQDKVCTKVAEIVADIPYFALATKKQLTNLISNSLALNELEVSSKDIQKFSASIYEMKKPVKNYILGLLDEKYGINVNNLTETPSFQSLLKTEQLIFYVLSKLAPKDSVLKEHLKKFGDMLKIKNGVESIDVAMFLNEIFSKAGLKSAVNETSLMQYLDFNQVADDLGKIGTILKLIRPMIQGGAPQGQPQGAAPQQDIQPPAQGMEAPANPGLEPQQVMPKPAASQMAGGKKDLEGSQMDDEGTPMGTDVSAEDAAAQSMGGDMGPEDEGSVEGDELEGGGMGLPPEEAPPEEIGQDTLTSLVSTIEDILSGLKSEIGMEGDHPDEEEDRKLIDDELDARLGDEGDEEGEVDFEEGDEEEGDEDEDIHIDIDSHNEEEDEGEEDFGDEEEEEEEEEEPQPKKKKPPFKK